MSARMPTDILRSATPSGRTTLARRRRPRGATPTAKLRPRRCAVPASLRSSPYSCPVVRNGCSPCLAAARPIPTRFAILLRLRACPHIHVGALAGGRLAHYRRSIGSTRFCISSKRLPISPFRTPSVATSISVQPAVSRLHQLRLGCSPMSNDCENQSNAKARYNCGFFDRSTVSYRSGLPQKSNGPMRSSNRPHSEHTPPRWNVKDQANPAFAGAQPAAKCSTGSTAPASKSY
jgi:hypothetical protein